jgi:hypothetical protein
MQQHMQFHGFCDHFSKNIYFGKIEKKEKQHMGIVVRPTSIAKYIHKWKGPCALYKKYNIRSSRSCCRRSLIL